MATRVVFHVGLMKSGTSFLQHRMNVGREGLLEQGVLFPGPGWGAQVAAAIDVLEIQRRAGDVSGAWDRMVDDIAAHPGTAVVSMEFFGPAQPEQIEKIVGSFPAGTVEVVITARDLNRTIPAMWQEVIKNSGSWTWAAYLEKVQESVGVGRRFWKEHRLALIAQRWGEAVGRDRVTIVTVPRPGAPAELLWERFCEAARLDPAWCEPVPSINESLGAASTELLRRVNIELAAYDIPWGQYSSAVKFGVAKRILPERRASERPIGMPVSDWLRDRAASMRANVEALGVRIVGDLDDLTPVEVKGVEPAAVTVEEQLDAAVMALATVLRKQMEAELGEPLAPLDSAGANPAEAAESFPPGGSGA